MDNLILFDKILDVLKDQKSDRDDSYILEISNPDGEIWISTTTDASQPESVVGVEFLDDKRCHLLISRNIAEQRSGYMAERLSASIVLIRNFLKSDQYCAGFVFFNIDDNVIWPGVGFSGARKDGFLVPDALFLLSHAYESHRISSEQRLPPWQERIPKAIWRGATTGRYCENWRDLPRIRLCEVGRNSPGLLDAKISNFVQGYESRQDEIAAAGYAGDWVASEAFGQWKYQVDIDGNTNSWPGLFQKLLSGSPVIKVGSIYRQWYYDRLVPWVNYVPCRGDLRDLVSQIEWLMEHDEEAREIGRKGRELALSLTYEQEMAGSIPVIAKAIAMQSRYQHLLLPEYPQERLHTDHKLILCYDPESDKCQQVSPTLLARVPVLVPLLVVHLEEGPRLVTADRRLVESISPDGFARVSGSEDSTGVVEIEVDFKDDGVLSGYNFKIGDQYLCAENDGRVTVSRPAVSVWECFLQR